MRCCTSAAMVRANRSWSVSLILALLGPLGAIPGWCQTATQDAPPQATELPTAKSVFEAYVKATGGKAAHEKINNMRLEGTFSAGGMSGPITIVRARPAKISLRIEIPGIGMIDQGTNGELAWDSNPMQGTQMLEGERKQEMIRRADFDEDLYPEKYYESMECIGVKTVADRECYEVQCKDKDGQQETRFYDKESSLLVQTVSPRPTPMGKIDLTSRYEDYRQVGGIKIPHKNVIEAMGQEQVIEFKTVEINVDLPQETFAPPSENGDGQNP